MTNLGEATDRLNEAIVEVELALTALALGVTAYVEMPECKGAYLGFGKIDQVWRLFFAMDRGEIPLVNCSRAVRVAAVARFDALLVALKTRAEVEARDVAAATDAAERFAAGLKP